MHYARARKSGAISTNRTHEERFWEKVDKSGECWEWLGAKVKGYGRFGVDSKDVYAHRFSYEEAYGTIPSGLVIDHICYNPVCVNPEHLRAVTPKQNLENRAGAQVNNKSSGVRGVYWHKGRKKWLASVTHNKKQIHIGLFQTVKEAETAVVAKRNELFTHNDMDRAA